MKPAAIVYSSNTGHTRRYAEMLSNKTGLPAYDIKTAKADKSMPVIYMGWLMASTVKDLGKARKRFDVQAVCGVGLCTTGALLTEVRKAARIPADVPLFTLQGGMDRSKLKGMNKIMIDTLEKMLSISKKPSEATSAMLELLKNGGNFVSEENLAEVNPVAI